jgi:signal transduction histidine kinase
VSARSFGGLGLGLFIVRAIVEAHGGAVRLDSVVGEGTAATVELPLVPPRT